ncbi:MAG: hypothetical protein IJZ39_06075 [Oscillospiraceae bacterium]|nr:hypothetical protein [Oscillospiraceae bacterium]
MDYIRFLIRADVCLHHDASCEIAAKIPGAQLRMYGQWGHGLYEEAKNFNRTVLDFLTHNSITEPPESMIPGVLFCNYASFARASSSVATKKTSFPLLLS